MAGLKSDCVFWLLYFVQLTNCVSSVLFEKEDNNLTEVLSDSGGMLDTNVPKHLVTDLSVKQTLAAEPKLRVKRQSSGGKYTDAAKMPQVKVLRLFLQMMKNFWASVYVGGAHPFHHEVPKPVVQLYRDKIMAFLFPKIGEEAVKD